MPSLSIEGRATDINLQKAEVANQKAAAEGAKKAVSEDQEWSKGAKSNAKKYTPPPSTPFYLITITERKLRQKNKKQPVRKRRKTPSSPPKKKTPAPHPRTPKPPSRRLEASTSPHSMTTPLRQPQKQTQHSVPPVSTMPSTPSHSPPPTLQKRLTDIRREDLRLRMRRMKLDACQSWKKSIRVYGKSRGRI